MSDRRLSLHAGTIDALVDPTLGLSPHLAVLPVAGWGLAHVHVETCCLAALKVQGRTQLRLVVEMRYEPPRDLVEAQLGGPVYSRGWRCCTFLLEPRCGRPVEARIRYREYEDAETGAYRGRLLPAELDARTKMARDLIETVRQRLREPEPLRRILLGTGVSPGQLDLLIAEEEARELALRADDAVSPDVIALDHVHIHADGRRKPRVLNATFSDLKRGVHICGDLKRCPTDISQRNLRRLLVELLDSLPAPQRLRAIAIDSLERDRHLCDIRLTTLQTNVGQWGAARWLMRRLPQVRRVLFQRAGPPPSRRRRRRCLCRGACRPEGPLCPRVWPWCTGPQEDPRDTRRACLLATAYERPHRSASSVGRGAGAGRRLGDRTG